MAHDVLHSLLRGFRIRRVLLVVLLALGLATTPHLARAADAAPGTWQIVVGDETLPGRFDYPVDAVVDSQGNLYVLEASNFRIQKLSPDGKPLAMWGSEGTGPGQFSSPSGIAVDTRGNVYVSDRRSNRIQRLAVDGTPTNDGAS